MAGSEPAKKSKLPPLGSLLPNIFVALICALGILVSVRIFRLDMARTLEQLDEKPVGTVYRVSNAAQRVSSRRERRERLVRYSSVYEGDIIASAAHSEVTINLINSETLELSENTTVRVRYRGGEVPGIELLEGEITVKSERRGLDITLGGEQSVMKVHLDPGTGAGVKVREGCTVKFYQGSGVVSSGGESLSAAAGNAFRTAGDGTFLPEPPMMMLSPEPGARLPGSASGKTPVRFVWRKSASAADDEILVEVSDTGDFTSLTGLWYSEDRDSIDMELARGVYYWKAFMSTAGRDTESSVLEEADSGKISIAGTSGIRALSPSDGSAQTIMPEKRNLRFTWLAPEEAEAVLLEVASTPEMARPRIRQLIKRTGGGYGSYISSELGEGRWFWRVHPIYPGGVSERDILSSGMGSGHGFLRVRPASAGQTGEELPSPISSFTLVDASKAPTGAALPELAPFIPETGDRAIPFFPPDNFTVEAGRTPDILYSWRTPPAFNPRFQISERSDFSGALVRDEAAPGSNTLGPYLKPGTYYWHITGSGEASLPVRLVVEPALTAPALETPRDNERLRIEEGKPVIFTWERRYYADHYTFLLYLEGRETPVREISSVQNNNVHVTFDPKTQGRFRWAVQGFSSPTPVSSGRKGLISQGHFTINPETGAALGSEWALPRITNIQTYEGSVKSLITLVSPASGINVPGIEALRRPLAAGWTSDEPLRNVQLIVSKNPDPSNDPMAMVKDAGSSSVSFPSLGEGIWYWIVRGDTHDSRGATPGASYWFNVLPIPLLPPPGSKEPKNQAVIGIAQLTRDRKITFSWDKVEGANTYIFSLLRSGNPPSHMMTVSAKNEFAYILEDLSILSHGDYLWQVEAIYMNDLGNIDQRGRIEQYKFSLDIQRSTGLQTQNQGTMYGL